ncbi:MAG: 3-dehydroquinate synthase II [archaeon]|jgi:3-dehydroquinate synthase II
MKELIIDIRPYNKELVTFALEAGVKTIIVDEGKTEEVHKLGKIKTIAIDGDLVLGKDFVEVELNSKEDEKTIVEKSKNAMVVVKTSSWKIIPLENLVSKSDNIYSYANLEDISAVLGVLEKGVAGIVFKPKNTAELRKISSQMKEQGSKIELVEAEVTNIKVLSSGDRACVDTCTMMSVGQGMLVGNTSNFLFLVNSESVESAYCDTRPFRVNAGAIHSYVMMIDNKTKYLSEVKSGDEVLCVDATGVCKNIIVGRNKIEERPLILIEAKVGNKTSGVVLQNAETIRLVQTNSKVISVSELKVGDKVLVRIDDVGRHFGQAIKEKLKE